MTGVRWIITAALLGGCVVGTGVGDIRQDNPPSIAVIKRSNAPTAVSGQCWASDTTPAVIETVTEHRQIRPEQRDKAGNIIRPAEFQTKTAQNLVQDRATVWFRTPCRNDMNVAFVASLQRALKARGRFFEAVSGTYDPATAESVRKFQAERGLDSSILSLDAARELGLSERR